MPSQPRSPAARRRGLTTSQRRWPPTGTPPAPPSSAGCTELRRVLLHQWAASDPAPAPAASVAQLRALADAVRAHRRAAEDVAAAAGRPDDQRRARDTVSGSIEVLLGQLRWPEPLVDDVEPVVAALHADLAGLDAWRGTVDDVVPLPPPARRGLVRQRRRRSQRRSR